MTTRTFETTDDMVAYVVSWPSNAAERWTLNDVVTWEWVDAEAGRAWDAEHDAIAYVSYGDPGHDDYAAAVEALRARVPEKQRVVRWSLVRYTGSQWSRHTTSIALSAELGEGIDGIWAKAPAYEGSSTMRRVKPLGIPTMLKRLGQKGLDRQIKDAEARERAAAERNRRNGLRRQARSLAEQLTKLAAEHPEIAIPDSLTAILTLADEEG